MQESQTYTATKTPESFSFADFISFRTMITLKIMQVVYLLFAVLITLGGLMLMFKGEERRYSDDLIPGGFMSGLLVIIIGNVIWRIWCEILIVFFTINKSLNTIEKNTRKN